ncbi:MAG: hypothetical protein N2746_09285 [Deltaproteobacteria bacterium]|nr:hypothetical protein [Deltaproteobacteria bacterium]
MRKFTIFVAIFFISLSVLNAQKKEEELKLSASVKKIIDEYNVGNYVSAAYKFFDVYENDTNQANQLAAEYFVGSSLSKIGLYGPSVYFFASILKTGANHPFYLKAIEGLSEAARKLKDDLVIPELLLRYYSPEFQKLPPETLNHINYLVGELSFRKGRVGEAERFFDVIGRDSKYFYKGLYIKAILRVRAQKVEEANEIFLEIYNALPFKEGKLVKNTNLVADRDLILVRNLAIMGLARNYYSLGMYQEAAKYYEMIERFDSEWIDSVFEGGWTYYQLKDYGRAIGATHTLLAPGLKEQFFPETYILRATVYFENCLYDEAKETLEEFYRRYKEMPDKLKPIVSDPTKPPEYFFDMMISTAISEKTEIPQEVRRFLLKNPRLQKFIYFILELDKESDMTNKIASFKDSRIGNFIRGNIRQQRELLVKIVGKWIQIRLVDLHDSLIDFLNQAQLIDFETVNAQRKLLQSSGEVQDVKQGVTQVSKKPKLKRPKVDSDKVDFYDFNGEYWKDEFGYYYYLLRDECKK